MLPELIIFDYGHTLIYEEYFDIKKGGAALYEHISHGKENIDRDEFTDRVYKLYMDLAPARRKLSLEVPADSFTRILREYYGIEFSKDEVGIQEVFWDAISPPHPIDGTEKMLAHLKRLGIKTAVISNLWYEEDVLKRRIERIFPNSDFSFFMSTCNYGFRKPNKILFDIAVKRAGTTHERTWFCGDEPKADVLGAYDAGITPVWFISGITCPYKFTSEETPTVPCIRINSWDELEKLLDAE